MEISKSMSSELIAKLHSFNTMLLSGTAQADPQRMLIEVANNARDFLGADLVDLYEYDQLQNRFIFPPILVGDKYGPFVPKMQIYEDDIALKVIRENRALYIPKVQEQVMFTNKYVIPRVDAPAERFVIRQQIISSAAIPLVSRNEKVGVLFVNYRSYQQFEKEQRDVIELFASLAALVIVNSRLENAKRGKTKLESNDSRDFIFISYAREDFYRVSPIYKKLIERGYKAWIDVEELIPGQNWDQEIQKIIKESKIFIACLSNMSVSKKGYFQKELKKGFDIYEEYPEGHIFMIPVILEECTVPSRFENIQWCNLNDGNGFEKLFKAVEKSLAK